MTGQGLTAVGAGQRPANGEVRRRTQGNGNGAPTYAAIDLGTNNCRLLVAYPTDDGFRVVDAFSRIVRLGEGLSADGALSDVAIERTIAALRVCASKIRRNSVSAMRSVATEACRRARNCDAFLDRVNTETGVSLEIISSGEEARLALAGCMPLLEPDHAQALVFDIGGGSTELIWLALDAGEAPRIVDSMSLPCGVVNLSERYGGRDVSAEAYAAMVEEIGAMLEPFEARHAVGRHVEAGTVQMLGTSGTVTTLAALHLGLPRYDRAVIDGCHVSIEALYEVIDWLSALSYGERVAVGCIGRERADLVLAGAAVLEAICRRWPVGRLRVADRGLREGILLGLMGARAPQPCLADGV